MYVYHFPLYFFTYIYTISKQFHKSFIVIIHLFITFPSTCLLASILRSLILPSYVSYLPSTITLCLLASILQHFPIMSFFTSIFLSWPSFILPFSTFYSQLTQATCSSSYWFSSIGCFNSTLLEPLLESISLLELILLLLPIPSYWKSIM